MPPTWIHDEQLNALSEPNITSLRASFQRLGAVVFGWHYFFYGGQARDPVIFGSADELIAHMFQARPGDHFTLFDLENVAPQAIMRLGKSKSTDPILISTSQRSLLGQAAVKSRWKAVVLIQRACGVDGRLSRCSLAEREPEDLTDRWHLTKDYDADLTWPAGVSMPILRWYGELFAFDEADLDRNADTGQPVETVSAGDHKRTLALVDGKRPDERGLVPESGAY